MNKHTSGPWQVSKRDRLYVAPQRGGDEEAIALVYTRRNDGPEQKQANARLIAAAPDYFSGCEALFSAQSQSESEAAISSLRIAHKKARGE